MAVRQQGPEVTVSVTDNGLGIPPAMLAKVFELFTQVEHSHEWSQGGLGIGLALVFQLVEMHGGRVKAESEGLSHGSTFSFTLPYLINEAPTPDAPVETVAETTTALRVLVVDDNIPSAKTTGWMLEMAGHTPTLAHDGPEAIAAARAQHPDVILLDIGLPGMSGYDVCRELHKDPAFADTIFIAQTGWGQERDRQEARDAGFDHHLVKPVKFEQIEALLADITPKGAPR